MKQLNQYKIKKNIYLTNNLWLIDIEVDIENEVEVEKIMKKVF